jgi:hypothetical protein
MTDQCRIIVRGGRHVQLQVATGPSVAFLEPTWRLLRYVEAESLLPPVLLRMSAADAPASTTQQETASVGPREGGGFELVTDKWVSLWMRAFVAELRSIEASHSADGGIGAGTGPRSVARVTASMLQAAAAEVNDTEPFASLLARPAPPTAADNRRRAAEKVVAVRDTAMRAISNVLRRDGVTAATAAGDPAAVPSAEPATRSKIFSFDNLRSHMHLRASPPPAASVATISVPAAAAAAAAAAVGPALPPTTVQARPARTEERLPVTAGVVQTITFGFRDVFGRLQAWYFTLRAMERDDFRAIFIAPRPQSQAEFANREAAMEQAKRNRAVAAMVFAAFYTLLMRQVQSDVYLLLLIVLEAAIFYVATEYKQIFIYLTKRTARARVNRVKDWVAFHVGAGALVRNKHKSAAANAVAQALAEDSESDEWEEV